ncbi:SDR family NAD(P)-dependent oxidoreductase [Hymenobacter actinosclerus]|uniref:Benzil reductase ((S)-benzoin forming) n=1 Tax=Hymenobacter actinosclerus TaxID=82805 RepID=A0A1I0GS31_9BACT|nr:SDR family NAD(P)-dependent oxidoreductase [Hymenobacter actinosclerus]SET74103.1 benzil reductase ((S)-benzoin forming) [Hymenobacter actinosclerus]
MNYYLITGASRGLGRALAEAALARPDTTVIGICRHATIQHARYQHQPLDLSDLAAVQHNLHKVFARFPDATSLTLINNAAVLGEIGYLGEQPNEHFEFVFDVNLLAPAMLMNTFLSAYQGREIPRTILNISSGAAQRAVDGWGAYSASKAALDALSRTAQKEQELRGSSVRIRSLSPGILDTPMQEHIRSADALNFSEADKFAEFYQQGQLRKPVEVAEQIMAWLNGPDLGPEVVLRIDDLHSKV